MDQGERIQELLEQLAAGDGATIVELLFCLADHVLTIPAHRRPAQKPENSSTADRGSPDAGRPGGRSRREAAGPEKVRLYTLEEDGKKIVPVFTTADRFLDWTDGTHQLLSLAGADLALVLPKESWLRVDLGAGHEVTLPPKSLALLADPEKLRPLLPEKYQTVEQPRAVEPPAPPPPAPQAEPQVTGEEARRQKATAAPTPETPPQFSRDELERALRGEPRERPQSGQSTAPVTPPPARQPAAAAEVRGHAKESGADDIFDSSTRAVPVVPKELATPASAAAAPSATGEEEVFDTSTRAVRAVPPSLAASWKVRDEGSAAPSRAAGEESRSNISEQPPHPPRGESLSAAHTGSFPGLESYSESSKTPVEPPPSAGEGSKSTARAEQRVIDEEQVLEQLTEALAEFTDVEEAYFLAAPEEIGNGAAHRPPAASRSWVVGILAPRQGVENRFHLISRLAELSREFFGEAGALEVYDDLHVESSASWRFFRSEIPFYVRERSRFESARERSQAHRDVGPGHYREEASGPRGYDPREQESGEQGEAHWQQTARSLLLDPSAYDSERSEQPHRKKSEPRLKRFWGFKGN